MWHISIATHFQQFSTILTHFHPLLLQVLCYMWMLDYDDGNHQTSCTFTVQEIGRWVVTHS